MELAALIVAFGVLVVSGIAAAAAVVQARAAAASREAADRALIDARTARDEAQELARVATNAFVRQAEAQEKANVLKEREMTPAPWSAPQWISGDLHFVTNTSGRAIKVERFEVDPDNAAPLIRVQGPEDGLYHVGDSFDFMATKRLALRVRKLTLLWRFADEPEAELRQFIIPL